MSRQQYETIENEPYSRWFKVTQVVLRVITVACTIASIVVMATSGTRVLMMDARYYYSAAFKFLMGVNIAVCTTVLLSLVALYVIYKKQSNDHHLYFLFLHDLIMMALMISASGAASAIGYVGVYGQPATFWLKICNIVEKFCVNIGISVTLSCIAFLCLFALTIISSYKLVKPHLHDQVSEVAT